MWNFILFLFFGVPKLLIVVLLINGALHLGQEAFGSLVSAGASSCLALAAWNELPINRIVLIALEWNGLFLLRTS